MRKTVRSAAGELLAVVPRVMGAFKVELHRCGSDVRPEHLRALHVLAHGPRSPGELAERFGVSLPTVSKTAGALERQGWVAREPDPGDRRRVLISITDEGERFLTETHAKAEEHLARAIDSLTDEELVAVRDGLTLLDTALAKRATDA
jgi:DNA-binding MarR family transcriptional regulator